MIKFWLIFIAGIIETWLFTAWNLSANRLKPTFSSLMMMSYMIIYLKILDIAFKDINSTLMIISYVLACGLGNYLKVKHEKNKKNENKIY